MQVIVEHSCSELPLSLFISVSLLVFLCLYLSLSLFLLCLSFSIYFSIKHMQGVIEYSISLFFTKMVTFTFMFWLPYYLAYHRKDWLVM